MQTITIGFTDQYGIEHPAAVAFIRSASRRQDKNSNIHFDDATNDVVESSYGSDHVSYSVGYWHDKEAMEAGAKSLTIHSVGQDFTVTEDMQGLTLEAMCINHLKASVLTALPATLVGE